MKTARRLRGRPLAIFGALIGLGMGLGAVGTTTGVDVANATTYTFTPLDLSGSLNADAFTMGGSYTSSTVYPTRPPATYSDTTYGAVPMYVAATGSNNVWLSHGSDQTATFPTSMSVTTSVPNAQALWIAGLDGGWFYDYTDNAVNISYTVAGTTHTQTLYPNDWCTPGTGAGMNIWVAGLNASCGDIAVARIDIATPGTLTNVTVTDAAPINAYADPSVPVFAITVASPGGGGTSGAVVYDYAQAPPDTHVVTRTPPPGCVISGTSVICNSYQLAGVGDSDARASLTAYYSAIVDCYNHGTNHNNPIESHVTTFTDSNSTGWTASKNGRLYVDSLTATPTRAELADAMYCPNPKWDAVMRSGTLAVTDYSYTLTFQGYSAPFIRITK